MDKTRKIISYKKFNPNFHHLRQCLHDDDCRFAFLYGGSSSSKSYSAAQAFVLECLSKGFNTVVFKKVGSTIADSIYKTFQEAIRTLRMNDFFYPQKNLIKCINGSYITFKGLDESEKIKGLESYQYVFCEEVSDFDEVDFKQIRKRLRGRRGQKIVSLFNPISEDHWIKKKIFDKEELKEVNNHLYGILKDNITGKVLSKEYSEVSRKWVNSARNVYNPRTCNQEVHKPDTVIIRSTYLNNFWVVGSPDGSYGFYDYQTIADFERDKINDYPYYLIYALGEWGTVKTGGEFFHAFDPAKHKGVRRYDSQLPIHITIDNNVLPYISVAFWQVKIENEITYVSQIKEIAAEDPFNTVTKASSLSANFIKEIGYSDKLFLYGDASTKAGNTIDDEKRSFLDKFKEGLEVSYIVEDRIPLSNPSVSMTGEFINAIYSGSIKSVDICIDEGCTKSIADYIKVKKDVNGSILKTRKKNKETGQIYEEYGHFSDTKRYFITELLKGKYTDFSLRRKHNTHKTEDMKYYDPQKTDLSGCEVFVYIAPVDGIFAMASGVLKDGIMYIDKASLMDYIPDNEYLMLILQPIEDATISFEVKESYFQSIRELRAEIENIKAGKEYYQKDVRINAYSEFVKNNFLFRSDYDADPEYTAFVERFMDCNGKENIEAANCIAAMAEYVRRNRKDEFDNNKTE